MTALLLFGGIAILLCRLFPARYRREILAAVSLAFYLQASRELTLLLAGEILLAHWIGSRCRKKPILYWVGILPPLFLLIFYKYVLPAGSMHGWPQWAAPLGISYFTFKLISYLDFAGKDEAGKIHFLDCALYIMIFPQITCGPIERADFLLPQIADPEGWKKGGYKKNQKSMDAEAICLLLQGLFKKIVIANRIAPYVDRVFANPGSSNSLALWLASFLFAIQIYCDFSGYSDLAIAFMQFLGFSCKPNFKRPYFASNGRQFWDRWHISLSTWLRDYIYIPLGGNRKGPGRRICNVLVTFLISGMWHGFGLTFLIWGFLHGLRSVYAKKTTSAGWRSVPTCLMNFFVVMLLWIPFRVGDLEGLKQYLRGMFLPFQSLRGALEASLMLFTGDYTCVAYFATALLTIVLLFVKEWQEEYRERQQTGTENSRQCLLWNGIFVVSLLLVGTWDSSGFLYAQF